jgi:hypothetical protein
MKGCLVAASLALIPAGCAGEASPQGRQTEAECTPQVRFSGIVYDGASYTDQQPSKRLGTADEADCHDEGRDAEGSVFSESPRQVAVWSLDGYSPEEVLAVRFDETSFAVFVAASMPRHRVDRIVAALNDAD